MIGKFADEKPKCPLQMHFGEKDDGIPLTVSQIQNTPLCREVNAIFDFEIRADKAAPDRIENLQLAIRIYTSTSAGPQHISI